MTKARENKGIDELIAESRRIQDRLIRVVVKLDTFAELLAIEAAKLQTTAGADSERIPEGEAPSVPPRGGGADEEGGGTDGGGGGQ